MKFLCFCLEYTYFPPKYFHTWKSHASALPSWYQRAFMIPWSVWRVCLLVDSSVNLIVRSFLFKQRTKWNANLFLIRVLLTQLSKYFWFKICRMQKTTDPCNGLVYNFPEKWIVRKDHKSAIIKRQFTSAHSHGHSFMCLLSMAAFPSTVAQLNSCNRDHSRPTVSNIYCLALYSKSFSTSSLNCFIHLISQISGLWLFIFTCYYLMPGKYLKLQLLFIETKYLIFILKGKDVWSILKAIYRIQF